MKKVSKGATSVKIPGKKKDTYLSTKMKKGTKSSGNKQGMVEVAKTKGMTLRTGMKSNGQPINLTELRKKTKGPITIR